MSERDPLVLEAHQSTTSRRATLMGRLHDLAGRITIEYARWINEEENGIQINRSIDDDDEAAELEALQKQVVN